MTPFTILLLNKRRRLSQSSKMTIGKFITITLITSIWINASEVFRYFILIRPQVQAFFNNQPGIAEMDWGIFVIWGFWDTLLTVILVFISWLFVSKFGNNIRSIFLAGTLVWSSVFVIFWVAAANMGLASWDILLIALPLSWVEMVVGVWIICRLGVIKS